MPQLLIKMFAFILVLSSCQFFEKETGGSTLVSLDSPDKANPAFPDDRENSPEESDLGPNVDRSFPKLYDFEFSPADADNSSDDSDKKQFARLDTRVESQGFLVVYLHGAGNYSECGDEEHLELLSKYGFHVISPCYSSAYGIGNCDDDGVFACRLEAFEGEDHASFISISKENSIERRVARALFFLKEQNPEADWGYFLESENLPKWSKIIVSGISHGATTAALIGKIRKVSRVVSLSGPNDHDSEWLKITGLTSNEKYWSFSHLDDDQHNDILDATLDLNVQGSAVNVDNSVPPYNGSHRLFSGVDTDNGHTSTRAGGTSPKDNEIFEFEPVWRLIYGVK